MRYEKAAKAFKVPSGDRKVEVPDSEFVQYDSVQDFVNHVGNDEKALAFINSVVRADSTGTAKAYAMSKDGKTMELTLLVPKLQELRKSYTPGTSGRSAISNKGYSQIGKDLENLLASGGELSKDELLALIAKAKAA